MSTRQPEVIADSNLSLAWGRAFLHVMKPDSGHAPLTLSVDGFDAQGLPLEDPALRLAVDDALAAHGRLSVQKTAFTIFPNDAWEFRKKPAHTDFGPWFRKWVFPFIYRANRANRSGTYFQRMVAFGAGLGKKGELEEPYVDQLAKILKFWDATATPRRSALQAACFDPARDHHGKALSGFPCLQQVSFSHSSSGELAVTGYYPSEYVLDRGYGNYLGLCHLGRYMAQNMGLRLTRMNCVISHPMLGSGRKQDLRKLAALVQERLDDAGLKKSTPDAHAILVK